MQVLAPGSPDTYSSQARPLVSKIVSSSMIRPPLNRKNVVNLRGKPPPGVRIELTKRTAARSPSTIIASTSSRISGKARNNVPYVRATSTPVRGLKKPEDVRGEFGEYSA